MMRAELDELLIISRLFPNLKWSSSASRPVVIAAEGNILRLYWMPSLLRLNECSAEIYIEQLNRKRSAST